MFIILITYLLMELAVVFHLCMHNTQVGNMLVLCCVISYVVLYIKEKKLMQAFLEDRRMMLLRFIFLVGFTSRLELISVIVCVTCPLIALWMLLRMKNHVGYK